jgi:hypothetical protein
VQALAVAVAAQPQAVDQQEQRDHLGADDENHGTQECLRQTDLPCVAGAHHPGAQRPVADGRAEIAGEQPEVADRDADRETEHDQVVGRGLGEHPVERVLRGRCRGMRVRGLFAADPAGEPGEQASPQGAGHQRQDHRVDHEPEQPAPPLRGLQRARPGGDLRRSGPPLLCRRGLLGHSPMMNGLLRLR